METKRKALGRGLEQLFTNEVINFDQFEKDIVSSSVESDIKEINIDEIRSNPYQPRKTFNEESLNELAESIKEHGLVQPIIVKKSIKGYELIAGERRTKASKIAGLTKIPAIIKDYNDNEMREIALIENIQREDLNPYEKATAIRELLDTYKLTQQQLADRLGISRSGLANTVRILNLDDRVIDLVKQGNITEGHCKALLAIDDLDKQYEAAKYIVESGDSVREVEKQMRIKKKSKQIVKNRYEPIYQEIEDSFRSFFGTKVKLEPKERSGKIIIQYSSNEDLDRILNIIK